MLFLTSLVGFFYSLYLYALETRWWLILAVIFELSALLLLEKLKDRIVLDQYGDPKESQVPPETKGHRSTRYLMFKKKLASENITKSHVEDCFDLVDIQIDMTSSSGSLYKKYSNFVIGLFAGLLVAIWRELNLDELVLIGISIFFVSILIMVILSLFPSKLEKLKEMKYFMHLYCREIQ